MCLLFKKVVRILCVFLSYKSCLSLQKLLFPELLRNKLALIKSLNPGPFFHHCTAVQKEGQTFHLQSQQIVNLLFISWRRAGTQRGLSLTQSMAPSHWQAMCYQPLLVCTYSGYHCQEKLHFNGVLSLSLSLSYANELATVSHIGLSARFQVSLSP